MDNPVIVGPWRGAVTVIKDGIEKVIELVGDESSAVYRAQMLTASGQYPGARAWACIGNYGICANEKTPKPTEDEAKPCPTVTLDKWGI